MPANRPSGADDRSGEKSDMTTFVTMRGNWFRMRTGVRNFRELCKDVAALSLMVARSLARLTNSMVALSHELLEGDRWSGGEIEWGDCPIIDGWALNGGLFDENGTAAPDLNVAILAVARESSRCCRWRIPPWLRDKWS